MTELAVALGAVHKTYRRGGHDVAVLRDVDLQVEAGEFVVLMGPSGSGKSTLLNLIAGFDRPTSGRVEVGGRDLNGTSENELARWRARNVGFIFQLYNLIPVLTARENVELPLLLTPMSGAERRHRAETALDLVGLGDRLDHFPRQMSGGEEQRVAIARAIVVDPAVLLADEPTGDLDAASADDILALLRRLNKPLGKTLVVVTHDPRVARQADTLVHLDKGMLGLRAVSEVAG
jgi:putative ABC transport system ATP-binding protein